MALGTSCYSHAQNPGQVTVTDYGDGAVLEVELTGIRLETSEAALWLELAVQEQSGECTPVRIRVLADDSSAAILESLSIRSVSGSAPAEEQGDWMVDATIFRAAIYGDPVHFVVSGESIRVHDEQVYNLRQFIEQVSCSE